MAELRDAIKMYFNLGLCHKDILMCLAHVNSEVISLRTLRRHLRSLGLFRRKLKTDILDVALFLIHQTEVLGNKHGYRFHYLNCIQNGYTVTQDKIRQILHVIDPEGINQRQRHRLNRRRYHNPGPNFMWHIDSYDKLKPYGICINGAIDGFSRFVVWLEVYKTSSDPKLIAGYFVNALKTHNGCPKRVRADAGTENGTVNLIQQYLRENHTDAFANSPFLYGSSNHNQRIESWWCFLRKHKAQQWMNRFQSLKDQDLFDGNFLDKNLIRFCFIDMIQNEMNQLVHLWNSHRIRPCRNAVSPSGKPLVMFCLPQLYGARNEVCQVEREKVDACAAECTYKNLVCDPTVYELCRILMSEESLDVPDDPEQGITLYKRLRHLIKQNL